MPKRTKSAVTMRIDQYHQYRELPLFDDPDESWDAVLERQPTRVRDFVNLSPDVPVPGRVSMRPAGTMEPGVCPACLSPFHKGDTIAESTDAPYVPNLPKFHAYCWRRALDERTRRIAKDAELVFGGGLS